MWTPEFEAFVAPARQHPQIWRTFLGTVLAGVVYVLVFLLILAGVLLSVGPGGVEFWLNTLGETPTSLLLVLATFLGMGLGTFAATKTLHKRPILTLFGPRHWRGFGAAAVVCIGVFTVSVLTIPSPFDITRNTPNDIFLIFLVPALLGILVQTGAEEVLFRGYLQQQFAARFRNPIMWMVVPSVMFGLLHWDPTSAGDNAIWIVAATTVFGLVAADLTRVTGSIGAAWGFHFVNNCIAMLVVAIQGPLSGLSYWKLGASASEITPMLIAQDMMITVIIWLLLRLWLARDRAVPA
ncbi:MAG: type II CAAX endopeptidase family protein [Pseudomonadota bacterium]